MQRVLRGGRREEGGDVVDAVFRYHHPVNQCAWCCAGLDIVCAYHALYPVDVSTVCDNTAVPLMFEKAVGFFVVVVHRCCMPRECPS